MCGHLRRSLPGYMGRRRAATGKGSGARIWDLSLIHISADPDFEIGWFAVPSPDGKTRLVGGGGAGGLAISAEAAKDPNKKAAAEEFIRFFFQPENYKFHCEKMSAIPATVESPDLDVLPVFQEVIDATETADSLSPMWNGFVGENELPPDFRNFMYKTLIEAVSYTHLDVYKRQFFMSSRALVTLLPQLVEAVSR